MTTRKYYPEVDASGRILPEVADGRGVGGRSGLGAAREREFARLGRILEATRDLEGLEALNNLRELVQIPMETGAAARGATAFGPGQVDYLTLPDLRTGNQGARSGGIGSLDPFQYGEGGGGQQNTRDPFGLGRGLVSDGGTVPDQVLKLGPTYPGLPRTQGPAQTTPWEDYGPPGPPPAPTPPAPADAGVDAGSDAGPSDEARAVDDMLEMIWEQAVWERIRERSDRGGWPSSSGPPDDSFFEDVDANGIFDGIERNHGRSPTEPSPEPEGIMPLEEAPPSREAEAMLARLSAHLVSWGRHFVARPVRSRPAGPDADQGASGRDVRDVINDRRRAVGAPAVFQQGPGSRLPRNVTVGPGGRPTPRATMASWQDIALALARNR